MTLQNSNKAYKYKLNFRLITILNIFERLQFFMLSKFVNNPVLKSAQNLNSHFAKPCFGAAGNLATLESREKQSQGVPNKAMHNIKQTSNSLSIQQQRKRGNDCTNNWEAAYWERCLLRQRKQHKAGFTLCQSKRELGVRNKVKGYALCTLYINWEHNFLRADCVCMYI